MFASRCDMKNEDRYKVVTGEVIQRNSDRNKMLLLLLLQVLLEFIQRHNRTLFIAAVSLFASSTINLKAFLTSGAGLEEKEESPSPSPSPSPQLASSSSSSPSNDNDPSITLNTNHERAVIRNNKRNTCKLWNMARSLQDSGGWLGHVCRP